MMHQRLMFGMLVYGGVIALIVLRILYLAAFGDHAGAKRGLTSLVPERGDIVDRDGVPLARTIDAWTIGLHPKKVIGDKLTLARKLAQLMGDTGSLALGGALGAIAVATHHEFVLAIVGGLFVIEALSVIIQVFFYKRTGKRVFRMAPIHHHFEQLGWSEPTVVIRFWIIAFVLALAGLSTLKLR